MKTKISIKQQNFELPPHFTVFWGEYGRVGVGVRVRARCTNATRYFQFLLSYGLGAGLHFWQISLTPVVVFDQYFNSILSEFDKYLISILSRLGQYLISIW